MTPAGLLGNNSFYDNELLCSVAVIAFKFVIVSFQERTIMSMCQLIWRGRSVWQQVPGDFLWQDDSWLFLDKHRTVRMICCWKRPPGYSQVGITFFVYVSQWYRVEFTSSPSPPKSRASRGHILHFISQIGINWFLREKKKLITQSISTSGYETFVK